ncbi:MAG: anti-sigma factor domain-containing protein [Akkermansiaceae bacterium]
MTDQDLISRFEELDAGRILGDLDAAEMDEWEKLARDPRCQSDISLELTAAALEAEFQGTGLELPQGLLEELEKGTADFVVQETADLAEEKIIRLPIWRRIFADKETGWAIAAIFLILFVAQFMVKESTPSPEDARMVLVDEAGDLIRSSFGGVGDYKGMTGEVVWSDARQEGYMSLANLPVNDPKKNQYQLWIVDPERDEKPVDGGVFDISSKDGTTIIRIRNPLVVKEPKLFVITLEQPGGVVVSKQEVVVAATG